MSKALKALIKIGKVEFEPIEKYAHEDIEKMGYVIVKRIWHTYESPPVIAKLKLKDKDLWKCHGPPYSCGRWYKEGNSKSDIASQAVDLENGWATHIARIP